MHKENQSQKCRVHISVPTFGVRHDRVSAGERRTAEMTLERDIEHRLQRLILRAKGMVSEEMLVQHRREIPVDEIPDYAVTHLLVELGEQELRRGADQ